MVHGFLGSTPEAPCFGVDAALSLAAVGSSFRHAEAARQDRTSAVATEL
jgi:hypothetical protein